MKINMEMNMKKNMNIDMKMSRNVNKDMYVFMQSTYS
jgi:hypothetical protein